MRASKSEAFAQLVDTFLKQVDDTFPDAELNAQNQHNIRQKLVEELSFIINVEPPIYSQQVTILLSDIRGFTQLSENYPPTTIIHLLNRYFKRMNRIIHQHNGIIDKFMGDAIMVLFGAPDKHDDDLQQALNCAVHMQLAMDEINCEIVQEGMPELFMGIGINTGEVVAGSLGSELHSEFTVIGDQVNLTSRIESHTLRGQILMSEQTYSLAHDYIETGNVNEVFVKGKRDPVKLYELKGVTQPKRVSVPKREVRKSLRVDVDMPFSYQMVDGKHVDNEHHQGQALDISYYGMRSVVPVKLDVLSDIKLNLSMGLLSTVLESGDNGQGEEGIYAKVLRVIPGDETSEVMMEFTSMSPATNQALKKYIDRIVESS